MPGSACRVNEAYVAIVDVRHLGRLQFGQFTPPVGLQPITSSWDIGLMEPAAALQAMALPPRPGMQASGTFFDRRGTWTAGAFAGIGSDGEYGSGSKRFGNFVGRATWLAIDDIDDEEPAGNHYLQLGASTSLQRGASGQLQHRSRRNLPLRSCAWASTTTDLIGPAVAAYRDGLQLEWPLCGNDFGTVNFS